jgi:hypothetical protein
MTNQTTLLAVTSPSPSHASFSQAEARRPGHESPSPGITRIRNGDRDKVSREAAPKPQSGLLEHLIQITLRIPNLEDRRSVILEATPIGFEALVKYRAAVMEFIEHLEGVLDAEEEQQLIRLIEKIAGSL